MTAGTTESAVASATAGTERVTTAARTETVRADTDANRRLDMDAATEWYDPGSREWAEERSRLRERSRLPPGGVARA